MNRIQWASASTPYRAHTEWNTEWEAYYKATNDPRVAWEETSEQGDAAIDCCGKVPWYPQMKYADPAADIRLSSGHEMRLIEAEDMLNNGKMSEAVDIINGIRDIVGVDHIAPTTMDEAWAMLKRERGIELWLEGRRLGDLRRWKENNTPGALGHLEQVNADSHLTRQDLCFPIPPSEQDTNPNVPKATG